MTVWIYIDTRKEVGDADYLKVFATKDAAEACFPIGCCFPITASGERNG
jgi:hypothetical protein